MSNKGSYRIAFRGDDIAVWGILDGITTLDSLPRKSDQRGFTRFRPCDFQVVIQALTKRSPTLECPILTSFPISQGDLDREFEVRNYQEEAVKKWLENDERGVIVLPTGAGKTYVALHAILKLLQRTLIVVPTLDLADQWLENIATTFRWPKEKVGLVTGSTKRVGEITVTTYDSALIQLRWLREKFGLLVFDEVHHLRGNYRWIAEGYVAPARLGLTATIDKTLIDELQDIVGPVVLSLEPEDLRVGGYLADFELRRVVVDLPPLLEEEYKRFSNRYRSFMRERNLKGLTGFQRMVMMTGTNQKAREAMEAYRKARKLAFDSSSKIEAIHEIIVDHKGDRILLFSESIDFVERLSREFLLPAVTSRTPQEERRLVLSLFRKGDIPIVLGSRIFDEGIDIPSASVGIVVSGSAQPRQFIQRLGRILRPSTPDKKAILYEVLSSKTIEFGTSSRRRVGTVTPDIGRNSHE